MIELRGAKEEVQALRSEVADLRANQDEAWLNERRAEEVKTLIRDVLSDADLRASLAGSGLTAGHDGKFFLASGDDAFRLNLSGHIQFRYIANFRADVTSPVGYDELESGFQLRRTKVAFAGHIGDPRINYSIVIAANRNIGNVGLEASWISYKLADDLTVKGGQFKSPFMREELTSSKAQLAVERSSMNEIFTLNRTQGVQLKWTSETLQLTGMINDGSNAGDIGGTNDFHNDASDVALTGRVDTKLAGEWSQMKDFAAWDGEPFGAFLGGAVHYEVGETGDNQVAATFDDVITWTVDGSVEISRFNLYAAGAGQHLNLPAAGSLDHYGILIQGGYMVIPDTLEPFARYEWLDFESEDEITIITLGVNWYHNKHKSKLTTDVVWVLDPLVGSAGGTGFGADGASSGLGLLDDVSDEVDDQVALRIQYQLLF